MFLMSSFAVSVKFLYKLYIVDAPNAPDLNENCAFHSEQTLAHAKGYQHFANHPLANIHCDDLQPHHYKSHCHFLPQTVPAAVLRFPFHLQAFLRAFDYFPAVFYYLYKPYFLPVVSHLCFSQFFAYMQPFVCQTTFSLL